MCLYSESLNEPRSRRLLLTQLNVLSSKRIRSASLSDHLIRRNLIRDESVSSQTKYQSAICLRSSSQKAIMLSNKEGAYLYAQKRDLNKMLGASARLFKSQPNEGGKSKTVQVLSPLSLVFFFARAFCVVNQRQNNNSFFAKCFSLSPLILNFRLNINDSNIILKTSLN